MGQSADAKRAQKAVKKQVLYCQVDGCSTKLSNCKAYCVRYRVCQQHLSAVSVLLKGVESRFCQQCGRFHDLSEFDGAKRSCRTRLAHHNNIRQQRRKEAATAQLLANSVLDLPRSSRPSAARAPGTFGYLINSPDHAPEYAEYDGPSSSSRSNAAATTTMHHTNWEAAEAAGQHHSSMAATDPSNRALGLSQQHTTAVVSLMRPRSTQQHATTGNSRWTEATAAEFFTRKQPTKRVWYEQQQQHQQQQQQQHQQQQQQEGVRAPSRSTAAWSQQPAAMEPDLTAGAQHHLSIQHAPATQAMLLQQQQHQQQPLTYNNDHLCFEAADSPTPSFEQQGMSDSPSQLQQYRQTGLGSAGFLQLQLVDSSTANKGASTPHSSLATSATTTGFAPSNSSSPSTGSIGMQQPNAAADAAGRTAGSADRELHYQYQMSSSSSRYLQGRLVYGRTAHGLLQAGDALAEAVLHAAADAAVSNTTTNISKADSLRLRLQHSTPQQLAVHADTDGAAGGSAFMLQQQQPGPQVCGLLSPETPTAYASSQCDVAPVGGTAPKPMQRLYSVPECEQVAPPTKHELLELPSWQDQQHQHQQQQAPVAQGVASFSSSAGSTAERHTLSYAATSDPDSLGSRQQQAYGGPSAVGGAYYSPGGPGPYHSPPSQCWTTPLQQVEAAGGSRRHLMPAVAKPSSRVMSVTSGAATGADLQPASYTDAFAASPVAAEEAAATPEGASRGAFGVDTPAGQHKLGRGSRPQQVWDLPTVHPAAAPSPFANASMELKPSQQQQLLASVGSAGAGGAGTCLTLQRSREDPAHMHAVAGWSGSSAAFQAPAQHNLTRHLSLPSHRYPGHTASAVLTSPRTHGTAGSGAAGLHEGGSGAFDPALLSAGSSSNSLERSLNALPLPCWKPGGHMTPLAGMLVDEMHVDHMPTDPERHAAAAAGLQRWRSEPAGPSAVHGGFVAPPRDHACWDGTSSYGPAAAAHTPTLARPAPAVLVCSPRQQQQQGVRGGGLQDGLLGQRPDASSFTRRRSSGNVPGWYLVRLSEAADAVINPQQQQQLQEPPEYLPSPAQPQSRNTGSMGPPAPVRVEADANMQHLPVQIRQDSGAVAAAGTAQRWHSLPANAAGGGCGRVPGTAAAGSRSPLLGQLEHSGSSGLAHASSAEAHMHSPPEPTIMTPQVLSFAAVHSPRLAGATMGPQYDGGVQRGKAGACAALLQRTAPPAVLERGVVGRGCAADQAPAAAAVAATTAAAAAAEGLEGDGVQGAAGDDSSWAGFEECLLGDTTDGHVADLMQWATDGADVLDLISDGGL